MRQSSTERVGRARLALFARTQSGVVTVIVLLAALVIVFDVPLREPGWLAAGLAIIAVATVLALVLPWERWPQPAQAGLAIADLVAVAAIAVAMYADFPTVSVLAAFPAVWLGIAAGVAGVVIGTLSAYAVAFLPLLVTPGDHSPAEWAAAAAIPLVIAVLTAVGRIQTLRNERAEAALAAAFADRSDAFAAREAAAADSARIGRIMRSFADGVDIGLLFLDDQGDAVIYNEALLEFGRLARYDDERGSGIRMWEADQVTPIPAEQQPLARIKRGEVLEQFLHWVGPRGAQRALIANGRQVHHDDGTFVGSMIVMQDITDVVRAGRAREDALATLAHELRTPLTSIVGYTDLLLLDDLPPASSARVEVILRNAEQLRAVTSVFLDGLHREADVHRERTRVRDLVEETVDVLLMTPGFADRELDIDVDPELSVVADREGIAVVLTNLLSNAVKFSRTCDRIAISAGADDHVWLTVRNSGSRIDPEDHERIFDRFYRGGNAQRGAVPGTGIGLSVSREIIAAHGGTLTADAVDDGASFTICLPRD